MAQDRDIMVTQRPPLKSISLFMKISMAVGEQEGKAWLRIMRTHNAGVKVEIMFFFDLG
jgi:hypothetical protein